MSVNYKVGDTVVYGAFGGKQRTVVVTAKYEDVKNGEPGFDARPLNRDTAAYWGYDDQIVFVIPAQQQEETQ